jgi:hypothetical protein
LCANIIFAVIVNSEIAFLRLNPSVMSPNSIGREDPVWHRTDECLKLLGFAIGKCMMKGYINKTTKLYLWLLMMYFSGFPISPGFNLTSAFCKLLLRKGESVNLSDLAQEHPDIFANLVQLQAKLPEELDAFLDQFEAATDTQMQFTVTGRLAQTYEALRFLDE